MLTFRPIASSSAGNAYLVTSGRGSLLVDCGLPIAKLMEASGFSLSSLDACLVSHSHGDHSKAVKDLMARGVDVAASPETLKALGIFGEFRALVIEPDKVSYPIGPWSVKAFEVVHDCPGTVGFLIADEDSKLLYLTDTAYSPYRFTGLTHIAVECNFDSDTLRRNAMDGSADVGRQKRVVKTHMSLERLVEMLKSNDLSTVKEIWLLHLSDQNSDEELMRAEVEKATGRPVYVAQAKAAMR